MNSYLSQIYVGVNEFNEPYGMSNLALLEQISITPQKMKEQEKQKSTGSKRSDGR